MHQHDSSVAMVPVAAFLMLLATAQQAAGTIDHCAEYARHPSQNCIKAQFEEESCDFEGLDGSYRCEHNNLYKGYGINGQEASATGFSCLAMDAEWCVGVTCTTVEVEDKTACIKCVDGYVFETKTTYKYHDRVISNLCLSTTDGTTSSWLYVFSARFSLGIFWWVRVFGYSFSPPF